MQINKIVDNSRVFRLEQESGASITVRKFGHVGQLVSVQVPDDNRREGIGSALMNASEVILSKEGIDLLTADFSAELSDLSSFYESQGFSLERSAPIKSVDMKKLLTSVTLRKLMFIEPDGVSFSSLFDLTVEKLD